MYQHTAHMMTIPLKYYQFVDINHSFNVVDCTRTTGIEFCDDGSKRAAYFDGHKLHPWAEYLPIPESVYINCLIANKAINFLVSKKFDIKLFDAAVYYRESMITGPRTKKYLTLYKAYESIIPKHLRDLTYSSIRHSLSHSTSHLTKQNVVAKLTELFGGLEVKMKSYSHCKVFHKAYWDMLIQTDKAIADKLTVELKNAEMYLDTFRLLK
jgi:hypothetical protein